MTRSRPFARLQRLALLLGLGLAAMPGIALAQGPATSNPVVGSPPWIGRYPVTQADVDFMAGMISHHAQAIIMCNWATPNGASRLVGVLCARIINAQTDEITMMQQWLRDRKLPVPEAKPLPMMMRMPDGSRHEMMMPGMLNDEQMKELENAKGIEYDRALLTHMIQHHQGAITMVNDLMGSPGAAQDDMVFKFSADVYADQSAEIERMQQMLSAIPPR